MDIRYAGANNFTGVRVPGYEAPSCCLLAPVAKALAEVEQDLRAGLRLYDCYRPVRSVQAFMAWVNDPRELSRKAQQYPDGQAAPAGRRLHRRALRPQPPVARWIWACWIAAAVHVRRWTWALTSTSSGRVRADERAE